MLWGVLLVIIGAIFWLNNLGYRVIDLGRDWPVFLIIIGIWMIVDPLLSNFKRDKREKKDGFSA